MTTAGGSIGRNRSHPVVVGEGLPSTDPPQPMSPGVLIIADDPATSRLLADAMRYAGLRSSVLSDGRDAVRRARSLRAGVVLLDLMVPFEHVHAVADRLQGHALLRLVPILVVSAHATLADRLESLRRGVAAHLSKPFDVEEVVLTTSNLLGLQRRAGVHHAATALPGVSAFREIAATWIDRSRDWAVLLLYPDAATPSGPALAIPDLADLALRAADELGDPDATVGHWREDRLAILTHASLINGYGEVLTRHLAAIAPTPDTSTPSSSGGSAESSPPIVSIGAVARFTVGGDFEIADLDAADYDLYQAAALQSASTVIVHHAPAEADWSPKTRRLARFWGNA